MWRSPLDCVQPAAAFAETACCQAEMLVKCKGIVNEPGMADARQCERTYMKSTSESLSHPETSNGRAAEGIVADINRTLKGWFPDRVHGSGGSALRSTRNFQRHDSIKLGGLFVLGLAEEVMVLQAHPVFGFIPKIAAQLQTMLRGEKPASCKDVVE